MDSVDKNKRIMVTGGLGFIGFNAVMHFCQNNEVCVIDDCSRAGTIYNIEQLERLKINVHQIDISHFKELRDIFFEFQPDIVIHLAAQVAVTLSINNPAKDFSDNIQGSFNLLELARVNHKKPIMLYASTNKVYGNHSLDIIFKDGRYTMANAFGCSEEATLCFETPYGCSKGAADQYFLDYARTYDIPTVVLRQSCIYGPHQHGMEDQGWVAWFAICSAFSKPVTIYGDGNQVRDVLYIDDLIQLYEKAIVNIDSVKGEVFNIGGGPSNTLSLNELLIMLDDKSGKRLDVSFSDWRKGDQKIFVCDVRKAERLLGWMPFTNPESGVQKLLDWINKEREHISRVQRERVKHSDQYDVSIVIPARNEEDSLPSVLDEIRLMMMSCPYNIEVIVVNDRSKDRTCEIARQYSFVKLIDSKYQPGKGGTLRSGFDIAKGTYIAMMDADFSHDALDLPHLVDMARRNKGLVVASRITGGSEEYTRVRAFGNVFLTWFFGILHGRYLSDAINGFKVFHRDIYSEFDYTSNAFEIEIELLVNTLRLNRPINEVPSRERARLGGKMKSSVIRHGTRFFYRILLERFREPQKING
jgi:CDP-paratose 2-epimerase